MRLSKGIKVEHESYAKEFIDRTSKQLRNKSGNIPPAQKTLC
jgi:hypothetical protein